MRFAWLSDTQLGFYQYGLERRRSDFEYAFESSVDDILSRGIKMIVHTGDLLNSNRPGSEALTCLKRVHRKLIENGARMLVITANHDMADPPWPTILEENNEQTGILIRDNQLFAHEGVMFYCAPFMSNERFLQIEWPKADVLLCHIMLQEFIGFPSPTALKIADMPLDKFGAILMGDIHVTDIRTVGGCLIGYPGSTELNSETEPSEKFWIAVEFDTEIRKVPAVIQHEIRTRKVFRYVISTPDQVERIIAEITAKWEEHKKKTGDLREPIVFLEYPSDLAGVMERFRTAFNPDKWILRFKSVIQLQAKTGMPLNPGQQDLTVEDILRSELAMRQDMIPIATQLITQDVNADAALNEFIEARIRAIEGPAQPAVS